MIVPGRGVRVPEVGTPEPCDDSPARRALQQPLLQQIRLVDVLDRAAVLADRVGQAKVLWVVGAVYAIGIALTLVAIEAEWSTPLPHLCAILAGLSTPQTGSMVRARWTHAGDVASRSSVQCVP